MAAFLFMMGNLKRRKTYSVVICLLIALAGMIFTTTVSIALHAAEAYDRAYHNMQGPHLLYWMEESSYKEEFRKWFENQPNVQSVKPRLQRDVNGAVLEHEGTVLRSNSVCHMLIHDPSDNMRMMDGIHSPEKALSKGEIYLPYVYKTANGLSVGEKVAYRFGGHHMHFVIAGFVEDPIYGGELVGGKFLFISADDMEALEKMGAENITKILSMN